MSKPTGITHIVRAICKDLDSDVRVGEGNQVLLDFPSIENNRNFAAEYFMYNVARKYEPMAGSYDPTEAQRVSLEKWVNSEHTCRVVNRHGKYYSPIGDDVAIFSELIQRTIAHISRILSDRWPDLASLQATSGATNTAGRRFCHPAAKLAGMPDPFRKQDHNLACVPGAHDLLIDILESQPLIAEMLTRRRYKLYDDVPIGDFIDCTELADWLTSPNAAVLDFVSKTNDEVRLIVKTGGMSACIQKMFGTCIRSALLSEGIDLSDQTINQEWAEIGSLTGLVATVDLSSASDNIALQMLSYFPQRWQEYFLATRDTHITVNGSVVHKLEKIAGMGNGFIFELETLLFYAMSLAVCDHLNLNTSFVSVYGDDIIIPSRGTALLERFFAFNGFTFNASKSFDGPEGFRESCGKHYYQGLDVTPFYIRREALTLGDSFHLFNGLSEWSYRTGLELTSSINLVLERIPRKDRHVVPLTWSSRSGLHYPCEGAIVPRERYCGFLQRRIITYWPNQPVTRDEVERYDDYTVYCAALLRLNARDVVYDFSGIRHLFDSKTRAKLLHDSELSELSAASLFVTPISSTHKAYGGERKQNLEKRSSSWI